MRGFGEAFDPLRQQQQVDDGEDYYVSSANFPVEGMPYPTVPSSAFFHQQQQQQQHSLQYQQHHLRVMTANPQMQYDSAAAYAAPVHPSDARTMNYPEVNLHHHFGGISPRHFNHDSSLVPPNLVQHRPSMHLYDMPTSPVGHPPMASPTNRVAVAPSPMERTKQQQKVRYDDQNVQSHHADRRRQQEVREPNNDAEAERYKEIYHQVFARHSRTPSDTRTRTEHTTTDYTRTEHTRTQHTNGEQTATSQSHTEESVTSESSTSDSGSFSEVIDDDGDWEENIRTTFNEMAGNLKNLGGIHCNQAGPDSTEVQLKLHLPVPMQYMDHLDEVAKQGLSQLDIAARQGFNTAVATLSPKKCNMPYNELDDQVYDMERRVYNMEQRIVGTMNELQGNVMPVYKSLFQSQSEESSADAEEEEVDGEEEDDDDDSTYEDPRFLAKTPQEQSKGVSTRKSRSKKSYRDTPTDAKDKATIHRVPSHIVITDAPSDFSSADSWRLSSRLSSTLATPAKPTSKRNVSGISESVDEKETADPLIKKRNPGDGESPDWIPAVRGQLNMIGKESPPLSQEKRPGISRSREEKPTKVDGKIKRKEVKPKAGKIDMMAEIPQMIDLIPQTHSNDEIVESFSEITTELVDVVSQEEELLDPPEIEPISPSVMKTEPVADEIMDQALKKGAKRAYPLAEKLILADEMRSFGMDEKSAARSEEDELMRSPISPKIKTNNSETVLPIEGSGTRRIETAEEENIDLPAPVPVNSVPADPSPVDLDLGADPVATDEEREGASLDLSLRQGAQQEELVSPKVVVTDVVSAVDEIMPSPVDTSTPLNVDTKSSSPRKLDKNEAQTWKWPLSPMYLRVMRLKKEKGLRTEDDNDSIFGPRASVFAEDTTTPGQLHITSPREESVDADVLVDEFLKPKSLDGNNLPNSEELQERDGRLTEDAKLDDAILEVFGTNDGDTPDDEIPTPSLQTKSAAAVASTPASMRKENHDLRINDVQEVGEADVPDDECFETVDETPMPLPEVLLNDEVESTAIDAPNDDTNHKDAPNDELASTPEKVEEKMAEEKMAEDTNSVDKGGGPDINDFHLDSSSLDEPFDAPDKVTKISEEMVDSEKPIYESDSSFRSARQGTISGHSRREREKFKSPETFMALSENSQMILSIPNTPEPSCDEIMSAPSKQEEHPSHLSNVSLRNGSITRDKDSNKVDNSLLEKEECLENALREDHAALPENPSEEELPTDIPLENSEEDVPFDTSVADKSSCDQPLGNNATDPESKNDQPLGNNATESECKDETEEEIDEQHDELMSTPRLIPLKESPKSNTFDEIMDNTAESKNSLSHVADNSEPSVNDIGKTHTEQSAILVEQNQSQPVNTTATVSEDNDIPSRTRKSRESLYKVQGFAEYCKKIEEPSMIPSKTDPGVDPSVPENKEDSASSRVQYHQRTLIIESEDPEESSLDDPTTRAENQLVSEPMEAETSSIDRECGSSDSDSEYSTTISVHIPNDSDHTRQSNVEEKSSIDDGEEDFPSAPEQSESESSFVEEQSDINSDSSSSEWSEEKEDTLPDMKSMHDQTEHDRHMSATRRFRNQIDVDTDEVEIRYLSEHTRNHILSSDATAKTFDTHNRSMVSMDETLQSRHTRVPSLNCHPSNINYSTETAKPIRAAHSMETHLTSPLTTSFTMDTPLAAASTLSSIRTFDHDSVVSSQQSLLRRRVTKDDESYISPVPSCRLNEQSKHSVAIPVMSISSRNKKTEQTKIGAFGILSFCGNILFSVIVFLFEWGRFVVLSIRGKRQAKIEYSPSRLKLSQPDQVLRREEIQDRSMDSFIHRTNGRQPYYLHHQIDQREHVATPMIVTPPMFSRPMYEDDDDEVGTCVGSIVPDTHPPTWEVISSPRQQPAKSFGAVKKAYSSISSVSSRTGWRRSKPEQEELNWT